MDQNTHQVWIRQAMVAHEGPLIRYAFRILGDQQRAQDVVQETFLRLLKEEKKDLEQRLAPWLFRVCRNLALDHLKKEKRMTQVGQQEVVDPSGDDPQSLSEAREKKSQILHWVEGLAQREREVVTLKFQNGMTYKEISQVTGLTVSHVGVILHHALQELQHLAKGN